MSVKLEAPGPVRNPVRVLLVAAAVWAVFCAAPGSPVELKWAAPRAQCRAAPRVCRLSGFFLLNLLNLFVSYTVWVSTDWYIWATLNVHANDLHVKMSMSSVFSMSLLRCVVCWYV